MKKKLAAFLCSVMCISAFTGCSADELAYLKMSSDFLNTMQTCVVEGTMQADIDFDALNDMGSEVAKATAVMNEGLKTGFFGEKSLKVDYDMNMNLEQLEYDMSFDVTYEGKNYDLGKLYYSLDKGVYVTSDTLWGAYQIYGELADGHKENYIMSEAFAQDFRKILSENRYIELLSVEDLTGVDMEEVVPEQNMSALYDAVFTFYEDVFDGFETGMVKRINGGYQIKADGHEVAQLLVDLLRFAAENPDQILSATEAYMMAVTDSVEAATPEETAEARATMEMLFAEARTSQKDFVEAAEQMAVMLEMMTQDHGVEMMLDGFNYLATVKKSGDAFDSVAAYTVKHEGKMVCSLVTDSVVKKSDVKINFPVKGVSADELRSKLAKLEDEKYNPVKGVSVTWGMYDSGSEYADIHTMRSVAEGAHFGSNYNWSEMIVENNRAYLPLRMIAEILGEEVGWENSTKTPFVMKDGERIDMKGKLQDDRAFVGIRDFEKLGYTVTYLSHKDEFDSYFDYKEVVIEK